MPRPARSTARCRGHAGAARSRRTAVWFQRHVAESAGIGTTDYPFVVNGSLSATSQGYRYGNATVTFPDATTASISVVSGMTIATYGNTTLELSPSGAGPDQVRVNGVLTTVGTVGNTLVAENNFTGIAPFSDQSRALIGLVAWESTGAVQHHDEAVRFAGAKFAEDQACKDACVAALGVAMLIGFFGWLALAAACAAGSVITLGTLTVGCVLLGLLCALVLVGVSEPVYQFLLTKVWSG